MYIYMYILTFNYDKCWICAQRVEICHRLNLHKISLSDLESRLASRTLQIVWAKAKFQATNQELASTETSLTLCKIAHVKTSTLLVPLQIEGQDITIM